MPTNPWFNAECRTEKRCVRRLEQRPRRADLTDAVTATTIWRERRRVYRDLLKLKRESFWKAKVDAERSSPQQLWQSIDALMGRGHRPAPSFSSAPPGCSFPGCITLDVNDVIAAVRALPDKQCSLDTMPTSLLEEHINLLAPFLVELFNHSLALGVFPASFKIAYITPLLKKSNLDSANVRSNGHK